MRPMESGLSTLSAANLSTGSVQRCASASRTTPAGAPVGLGGPMGCLPGDGLPCGQKGGDALSSDAPCTESCAAVTCHATMQACAVAARAAAHTRMGTWYGWRFSPWAWLAPVGTHSRHTRAATRPSSSPLSAGISTRLGGHPPRSLPRTPSDRVSAPARRPVHEGGRQYKL